MPVEIDCHPTLGPKIFLTSPDLGTRLEVTIDNNGALLIGGTPVANGYQVYKPVDESLANDTTLQDDDHLKFPMLANEIWQFEFFLFVFVATATPDIKLALNGPAGLVNLNTWHGAIATDIDNFAFGDIITAYETTFHPAWGNPADPVFSIIKGTVKNGATPGDLVLRWAQFNSNATPTTIQQGSYLLANKLG